MEFDKDFEKPQVTACGFFGAQARQADACLHANPFVGR
jgi:hypothetical protein